MTTGRTRLLLGLQRWSAGLAICGMLAAQAHAVIGFQSAEAKSAIAACETQRAPLVARQKEYEDLKRARLGQAMAAGAKAGAGVLLNGALAGMTGGLSMLRPGGLGASIPGMGGGAGGAAGSGEGAAMLSQALSMNIPGLTSGGGMTGAGAGANGTGANEGADYSKALIAVSLITAVAGTIDAYMKIKQEQFNNDARRMAISIDGDAGTQTPVAAQMTTQVAALADCRQKQVADLTLHLSSASNDKDRKQLDHRKSGLQTALKTDLDLSDDLVGQQAKLDKTFIQGRAMAEGKSEADILGGQPPAYGGVASQVKLSMPAPPKTAAAAGPAPVALVTTRSTAVRSAPNVKASIMLNFPAGRTLTPKSKAAEDAAWWQVDIGGTPGFIRGVDLAEANSAMGAGKTKGAAAPQLAPPNNIRSLNRQVLAAKTNGVDRLKTLSTEVQTSRLEPGRGRDRREAQAVAPEWVSRGRAA